MDENNNTMGQMGTDQKKGSGALVGSVIIVIIIIIAGIYVFKNAKTQQTEDVDTINDSVVNDLDTQGDGDELVDIESDLNATNLDEVVPGVETEVSSK